MVDPAAAPAGVSGVKGETRVVEPTRAERTIARRSAESRATVPHLELSTDVDMDACLALQREQRCSVLALVVRACALALREHPRANGSYRDGQFELHSRVNVAVSVQAGDAYLVPTVFDADRKSLSELNREIGQLARRAQEGGLAAPELSGATFTVGSIDGDGVARSAPLITPPQAAALSAGAIRPAPVARDEAIVLGHCMTITLACDHRILFGPHAAGFLHKIDSLLASAAL
jgi:pyruvate dehydrogenase E2 component (dihydrolipoamide acetyltransferase)